MKRFDLLGQLPTPGSTTVIQASAGTGKTFTLAGLVARYIAEGLATLDEMLLITFSRAATCELRDRVRSQIRDAAAAFDDSEVADDNEVIRHLLDAADEERSARRRRLREALAHFDAATVATIHQFCHLVLESLGVAGDNDPGVRLVEDLDELVTETVDDLYVTHFGPDRDEPEFSRGQALKLARAVVNNPATELRPADPLSGSAAAARLAFAREVSSEVERRKRRQGIFGYDDLLTRLAAALESRDSPARQRMRQRWPIVMVDEFQDTDLIQWQVIDRAFRGHSTVILIGDPKQAIYAFRGGDIVTYLHAAKTAGTRETLATNWRSDEPLVKSLHTVLRGAALGDTEIVVDDVDVDHRGHRLAGAPHNAPFRLRVVNRTGFPTVSGTKTIGIEALREHITADLAADIRALLANKPTFDGRPVRPRDIAVIVERHQDAHRCRESLAAVGIPAVSTGGDVFETEAAKDWLCLLEALDQPHRDGLVRAATATMFFGETAETLAQGGDALTERVADTLRSWADHARERGMAAVFEAAQQAGMGRRVLGWEGGDRHMTDLAHIAELLQDTAHRQHYGLPALRDWLRLQCAHDSDAEERRRRLDNDAKAVQIMTYWGSKGLQFPIVYLPFAFNRNVKKGDLPLFHDEAGTRCLYIGGDTAASRGKPSPRKPPSPGKTRRICSVPDCEQPVQVGEWCSKHWAIKGRRRHVRSITATAQTHNRAEEAGDNLRQAYVALTQAQSQVVETAQTHNRAEEAGDNLRQVYVALTRAQSQVVAWWAPSRDEIGGGLSRLLRGRRPGERDVPEQCPPDVSDEEALRCFRAWQRAGGPVVEESVVAAAPKVHLDGPPKELGVRRFDRPIDTAWRRTSYSGLVYAVDLPAVSSEPEIGGLDDETGVVPVGRSAAAAGTEVASPMSDLPGGATFGNLVHAVLQNADPLAADLTAELESQIRAQSVWWPVDVAPEALAAALVPMHETPLGPLGGGLTLRQIGFKDRLRELGFELPLAGGDVSGAAAPEIWLRDVGRLLAEHLADDDPVAPYAERLMSDSLGGRPLRGYLTGQIDAVVRIPDCPEGDGLRYLVVDYKTNRLGEPGRPLTAAHYGPHQLAAAMLHSDYPLQALFYLVALHRFLRWRQPGYDPARHLGGALYLFLRGMCGADTPITDGHPAGIFSWSPPTELVPALSDLLDRGPRT
jgi:exodeoxyribonuclease V beta subunit